MKTVTTREVQHHLAKVMALVESGEEVVVTRRGKRVARLSPYEEPDTGVVTVPDFGALRATLGANRGDGENEVLRMRDEGDGR